MARVRDTSLDGMRGAVVLTVLAFHAWQYAGGQAGRGTGVSDAVVLGLSWSVSWFFVVTGFLVFASYARALVDGGRTETAGRFLARRLVRVLPAYWTAVLIIWAARTRAFPGDLVDLVEHLTLTHVFDQQRIFWTLGPGWSLTSQVLVYVFAALLWLPLGGLARRLPRAGRVAVLTLPGLLLIAAGVAYQYWALNRSGAAARDWPVWFHPLAQAPAMGAGMLLAVVVAAGPRALGSPRGARTGTALAVGAVAGLAAMVVWQHGAVEHGVGAMLVFRAASGVVSVLFLASILYSRAAGRWRRWWGNRSLAWIGTISFSVYLWHEAVMLSMGYLGILTPQDSALRVLVLLLLVALPVSWFAHVALERPFGMLTELLAPRVPFRGRYERAYAPEPLPVPRRTDREPARV
ncbi:acyltransferase family protein [Luteipulveratus flavus]|uniref:Acyltransferase n=1 Tax=Luteipulveratus flavus TaxID=3031728 RepID=A0ABT6C599_9MICO|nr:acyltransferase [Luteipulveratus sp. YIM 133296]MDF8263472.1 acyltransferase [Luteipulveratus sp. YIM 133296]